MNSKHKKNKTKKKKLLSHTKKNVYDKFVVGDSVVDFWLWRSYTRCTFDFACTAIAGTRSFVHLICYDLLGKMYSCLLYSIFCVTAFMPFDDYRPYSRCNGTLSHNVTIFVVCNLCCSCLLAISHSGPVDKDLFLRYSPEYKSFACKMRSILALHAHCQHSRGT